MRRPLGRTPFDRSGVPQVTGKELSPSAHQKSEVRNVLRALVADGWTLRGEGHWGRLHCPCGCSAIQVPGTPRNPGQAARRILREARRCPLPQDDPRRLRPRSDSSPTSSR